MAGWVLLSVGGYCCPWVDEWGGAGKRARGLAWGDRLEARVVWQATGSIYAYQQIINVQCTVSFQSNMNCVVCHAV